MITKHLSHLSQLLSTSPLSRTLVHRFQKPRNPFNKTNFMDDWIEQPWKHNKLRKPSLPHWEDPNVNWPPILPPPTPYRGRNLLRDVNAEEMERVKLSRPFDFPDFRAGDVLEWHFLHSMSEGKGNLYRGVCLGVTRRNSWAAGFYVMFNFGGVRIFGKIHFYSPFLAHFALVQKGSGDLQQKMFKLWDKNKQGTIPVHPVIRKFIKRRKGDAPKGERSGESAAVKDTYEDPLLE